jgi:tRNA uridine 5-carboxymethylaminomethyl modification enzyme
MDDIMKFDKVKSYIEENDLDQEILEQAEIQVKYSGYIDKERNNADKLTRLEDENSRGFDYHQIKSMSIEARQKLTKIRPVTISQASRISGVSKRRFGTVDLYEDKKFSD